MAQQLRVLGRGMMHDMFNDFIAAKRCIELLVGIKVSCRNVCEIHTTSNATMGLSKPRMAINPTTASAMNVYAVHIVPALLVSATAIRVLTPAAFCSAS